MSVAATRRASSRFVAGPGVRVTPAASPATRADPALVDRLWGGRPPAALVGIAELVAAVLLLIPRTAALGASLALLVISGAVFTHLTALGIEVAGDGGLLFMLALVVAFGSLVVLAYRWRDLPFIGRFRRGRK